MSEKNFFKKKVSREIVFAFNWAVSRSATKGAFVFLAKFAKQEVHDDLNIFVDEPSPYDLSTTTGGIKIYQCHMIKK